MPARLQVGRLAREGRFDYLIIESTVPPPPPLPPLGLNRRFSGSNGTKARHVRQPGAAHAGPTPRASRFPGSASSPRPLPPLPNQRLRIQHSNRPELQKKQRRRSGIVATSFDASDAFSPPRTPALPLPPLTT